MWRHSTGVEPLRHEGEAPKEPTERSVHKQGERRGDGVAGIAHEQRGRDERRPAVAGGQRARRRGTSDVSIGAHESKLQVRAALDERHGWECLTSKGAEA